MKERKKEKKICRTTFRDLPNFLATSVHSSPSKYFNVIRVASLSVFDIIRSSLQLVEVTFSHVKVSVHIIVYYYNMYM